VVKENPVELSMGIQRSFLNPEDVKIKSWDFSNKVRLVYSEKGVLNSLLEFYNGIY